MRKWPTRSVRERASTACRSERGLGPFARHKAPPISGRSPDGGKPFESRTSTSARPLPCESTTMPVKGTSASCAPAGCARASRTARAAYTLGPSTVNSGDRQERPETVVVAHRNCGGVGTSTCALLNRFSPCTLGPFRFGGSTLGTNVRLKPDLLWRVDVGQKCQAKA